MKAIEGRIIEASNGMYPEYVDGQPTGQELPYVHLVLTDKNAHPLAVASGAIQRYNLNILFKSVEEYENTKKFTEVGAIIPFFVEMVKVAPFCRVWAGNTSRAGQTVVDNTGNAVIYEDILVITLNEFTNANAEAMRIRARGIKQGTMFDPYVGDAHQENPAVEDNVFIPDAPREPTNGAPQQGGQQQGGQQPRPQFNGNGRQH